MARRRYISTTISHDVKVNRLATDSDFAALLYTWMIPHAEDSGIIPTGDLDELLMIVMPGRRDVTVNDISDALELMQKHDLVWWHDDCVEFPPDAFYQYQSYIKATNRRTDPLKRSDSTAPQSSRKRRTTPNNAEKLQETPENAVSSSLPPSLSPSPSSEVASDELWDVIVAVHGEPATKSERGKFNKARALLAEAEVSAENYPALVQAYVSRYGGIQPAVMTVASRVGEMRQFVAKGRMQAPDADEVERQRWVLEQETKDRKALA